MNKIFCSVALALCSAFALPAVADNAPATTTVPLQVIHVSGNNYKIGITVSVAGGPPTLLTFDTGGEGLHIFASQVGNMNLTYTNKHAKSAYTSGLVYEGTIAYAPVTIGGISTQPIPVLVIQKVYCMKTKPNCNAPSDPNNPSPVLGRFYGELGAGMAVEASTGLYTPFRAMPGNLGTGYIVQGLNKDGSGQLVLGLTQDNTAGFNTVQLNQVGTYPDGKPVFDDKGLMVNYTIGNFSETVRTAFDTGGDAVVNVWTNNTENLATTNNKMVRVRQQFTATLPGGFNWSFTTGKDRGVNTVVVAAPKGNKGEEVNTGISFFLAYDVMFNFQDGQLGFKQH
ncbi:MAG: hypothetical protein K0S29_88 [Gammaproteobacteria bacterium]|nr:hypothetical protein [Gammaproteobacteria bacterium]